MEGDRVAHLRFSKRNLPRQLKGEELLVDQDVAGSGVR